MFLMRNIIHIHISEFWPLLCTYRDAKVVPTFGVIETLGLLALLATWFSLPSDCRHLFLVCSLFVNECFWLSPFLM